MKYDTTQYRVWTWKHPFLLHWMINPGVVINELVLGMRVPQVLLIERHSNRPRAERNFVPCPHCDTLHCGLKWTPQNGTAFRNWFGLYCDHCGGIIPCLPNLTSLLVLALTCPFWLPFRRRWKQRWLAVQRKKFSRPLNLTAPRFPWWKAGLEYGLYMWAMMDLLFPFVDGTGHSTKRILAGLLVWICGGLLFGLLMKGMFSGGSDKPDSRTGQAASS